jgi:hypothetical protein
MQTDDKNIAKLQAISTPFGPLIAKFKMSDDMIKTLNDFVESDETQNNIKELDWSRNLVGKVHQEILVPPEKLRACSNFFHSAMAQYLNAILRSGRGDQNGREDYVWSYASAWIVRSFPGEYNPVHMHPEADIASVGYLKLPNWNHELAKDATDHAGNTHGCLEFLHGSPLDFAPAAKKIIPVVGDFYLFPASLRHVVYPFSTEGERRSFSANLLFKPESTTKIITPP